MRYLRTLAERDFALDKGMIEPHDAQFARRVAAATTPVRGAA